MESATDVAVSVDMSEIDPYASDASQKVEIVVGGGYGIVGKLTKLHGGPASGDAVDAPE